MKKKRILKMVILTMIISTCCLIAMGQDNWTIKNTSNSGLVNNIVTELFTASNGDTWVGTKAGLNKISDENWDTYSKSSGLPHKFIMDIGEDKSGKIWVATFKGIAIFDGQSITHIEKNDGIAHNKVYALETDSKGNVWVGTRKGLSVYDGKDWKTFTTKNGLLTNFILDVMEDDAGNIWVATKLGVNKFDGTNWTSYTKSNGLARNFVWSLDQDSKGKIWIGTHTGAFNTFDGTNWEKIKKGSGYYNYVMIPLGILTGIAFTLIFGNAIVGGVVLVIYAVGGAFPSASNYAGVFIDTKDNAWLSAQPKGVFMFDGQDWMQYDKNNGLPHKRVYDIMESEDGDMWFGTHKGIAILKKS